MATVQWKLQATGKVGLTLASVFTAAAFEWVKFLSFYNDHATLDRTVTVAVRESGGSTDRKIRRLVIPAGGCEVLTWAGNGIGLQSGDIIKAICAESATDVDFVISGGTQVP
jgi:hypothetical protein